MKIIYKLCCGSGEGWGAPLLKARGGDGELSSGEEQASLSQYVSLRVSVRRMDMYWYDVMFTCSFIAIIDLLPDNNRHFDPVEWEPLGEGLVSISLPKYLYVSLSYVRISFGMC